MSATQTQVSTEELQANLQAQREYRKAQTGQMKAAASRKIKEIEAQLKERGVSTEAGFPESNEAETKPAPPPVVKQPWAEFEADIAESMKAKGLHQDVKDADLFAAIAEANDGEFTQRLMDAKVVGSAGGSKWGRSPRSGSRRRR